MADELELFLVEGMARRLAALIKSSETAVFGVEMEKAGRDRLTLVSHVGPENITAEARATAVLAFEQTILESIGKGQSGFYKVSGARNQYCLVTLFLDAQGACRGAAAFITAARDKLDLLKKLNLLNGVPK